MDIILATPFVELTPGTSDDGAPSVVKYVSYHRPGSQLGPGRQYG